MFERGTGHVLEVEVAESLRLDCLLILMRDVDTGNPFVIG
jgi:hypothetical protein